MGKAEETEIRGQMPEVGKTADFRIIGGAKRHHYSMFDVRRSSFDELVKSHTLSHCEECNDEAI